MDSTMNLSPKLGPRARTLASSSNARIIDTLVEVSRSANLDRLARALKKTGAHVYASRASTTGFIRVEVPANHLNDAAEVSDDVLYIETDDRFY
jgi:hypothetical protein